MAVFGLNKTYTFFSLLIIAAAVIAYYNSFQGQFLWDDTTLVKNNPALRGGPGIKSVFTKTIGDTDAPSYFYRPLQLLSYSFDHRLWGFNPVGYHITNLLLHILTALALFRLVACLFGDRLLAFLTALLFVVHPIHTEAVSYISGRADSLALLFMLLCFICYIRLTGASLYLLTFLTYGLALLSKEGSIVFPALILLYHVVFKRKINGKAFLLIITTLSVYLFLRLAVSKSAAIPLSLLAGAWKRTPGFFVAIAGYLRLLFLPWNLHMEYGNQLFKFSHPQAIAGVGATICLIAYAGRRKNTNPLVSFAVLWFFITLIPVANIYPPLTFYMAEHFLYVPSVGFFLILGKWFTQIYSNRQYKIITAGAAILLIIAYCYLTARQNYYWREPIGFYRQTIKYSPRSARPYFNLANEYNQLGRYQEAVTFYKKAIEIEPQLVNAYNNLGVIYSNLGKYKEAIISFETAFAINPEYPDNINNMGIVYFQTGRIEEAINAFEKLLKKKPGNANAHQYLAALYYKQKKYNLAIKHCDRAAELGSKPTSQFSEDLKKYRQR
jgi:tetratricopeptide (TPR) repeat protein